MTAGTSPVPDGLPAPQRQRAVFVIVLGITMAVLDGTIVNLALPSIARELQADAAASIWVVNAYQVATLGLLLPLASLGDILGYRRVYLCGVLVFTAASACCALSGSLTALTLSRALQGFGAAGIMSVNTALVRLIYPRSILGRGIALNSMVVATASVAGPSIAALILSAATWPWLFAINLPLGLLTLVLARRSLPPNAAPAAAGVRAAPLDIVLNAAMFGLIFLGVDGLGTYHATAGQADRPWLPWAQLAAGLAVGVLYLRRQRREAVPLFPLDLLRIPVFALSMGTSIAAFCAQMLAYVGLPFLLLETLGRTHLVAGLLMTCWPLAIVVAAPLAGKLIGRYPDGLLGGIGLSILALGLGLLAALPSQPVNADIAWRMAVCGLGFGLFQSPNNHTIITSAPPERSGGASGMLGTARLTGQTIGAVMLAIIFRIAGPHDGHGPVIALGLAAACAAIAAVFSSLRLKTPAAARTSPAP